MFVNNFGKCGPIFKILSSSDSRENFLCILHNMVNMVTFANVGSVRLPSLKFVGLRVVERRSLTGELCLSCARPAADG